MVFERAIRAMTISPQRQRALARAKDAYEPTPDEWIDRHQLARFNDTWERAVRTREFYRHWQSANRLPLSLTTIRQLDDFPALTKAVLRDHEELVFAESSRRKVYSTGGSTAEPTRFPRSSAESTDRFADNYVGRTWWGIDPMDSSVLVWGHSHLFGSGWRGRLGRIERAARDWMTNTVRLDGYLISDAASSANLHEVIRRRPTHVIGYGSALGRMARAAVSTEIGELRALNLKGLVSTSETITPADVDRLRGVFQCPVIIEYGAAETGVIAVSREATWNIEVLWRSHLLRSDSEGSARISTLRPRQFPLVNYDLGDVVSGNRVSPAGTLLSLDRIDGRTLDFISVEDTEGAPVRISALHLTHMLKGHAAVRSVQFAQHEPATAGIYLEVDSPEDMDHVQEHFRRVLGKEYPSVPSSCFQLVLAQDQQFSPAGKHRVMRVSR